MGVAGVQFPGQLGGALALGDGPQDQHQLRGAAASGVEAGAGEGVEDPAAVPALVIEHRIAFAAVHPQAILPLAAGTTQAPGVQLLDQPGVAGVFVH